MRGRGPIAAALVLLAPLAAPLHWQAAAALQRGALAEAPWRLWSGHLVHFGWPHALADALALALLLGLRPARLSGRALAGAAFAAAPLLSLAILRLEPALREYRGASGLVVGLAVWVGVAAWQARSLSRRGLGLLALALVAKLAWDALGGHRSPVLPAGVSVAWSAHAAGALLGALFAAAWVARQRRARGSAGADQNGTGSSKTSG